MRTARTFLCVALLLAASHTHASEISRLGMFGVGIIAGFAVHEYGHQAIANTEGVDMRWTIRPSFSQTEWIAETGDPVKLRSIATGGFIAQGLSTEVLLAQPRNEFTLGWLAFNIANGISYVVQSRMSKGGGDILMYEESGGNRRRMEIAVVAHALFSAYRLVSGYDPGLEVGIVGDRLTVAKRFVW